MPHDIKVKEMPRPFPKVFFRFDMYVLGIETSCDETAVATTRDDLILSSSVSSSVHLHRRFGGVVPEIASRYHVEYINYVLKDALCKARVDLNGIGLIAVTTRPGLAGALLVGESMAKALGLAKGIPVTSVDHVYAHLYSVFMKYKTDRKQGRKATGSKVARYPFIGFVVSGGHTSLFSVRGLGRYRLLGRTVDDAAGEAFDKVSKLLNLGYPGGPAIEKRAREGRIDAALFPVGLSAANMDFSFSGIKTSVLYHIRDCLRKKGVLRHRANKANEISRYVSRLGYDKTSDIAASFQHSMTEILTEKAVLACKREGIRRLVLGGGVSANRQLRDKLSERAVKNGISVFIPPIELCLDNAAMVAGLGSALFRKVR